jgi:2-C-methyl-D-erythritol 4-phosphate cytidylyltransferase/2-C-methyl-D-erythritol 2,4-cyclodiphosphate synthase
MAIATTTTASKGVHAVIPAAGRGVRFGSGENKIFARLAGRPVIGWTVAAFAGRVDTLVLAAREDEIERVREIADIAFGRACVVIAGGENRQESVARGIASFGAVGHNDIVLVHDAARPLVRPDVIERCIEGARTHGAAVAALPVADTLKQATGEGDVVRTVERDGLWAVQTPQAFRLADLQKAHAMALRDGFVGTDEASLVERLGTQPVRLVAGARENVKLTTASDLAFAETWLGPRMRIGIGYDIHRLVAGRPLWLGGINIPSPIGLDGHSDADVVLHAICDAFLGAAGLPDIGQLYPNQDPAFAGISSIVLLRDVVERLTAAGFHAGNVDCMVIAEEPKIAGHAPAMRALIAKVLGVEENAVSIKATTNEGLGALGKGQGIACHATASVILT